jgi:hypothetical protein
MSFLKTPLHPVWSRGLEDAHPFEEKLSSMRMKSGSLVTAPETEVTLTILRDGRELADMRARLGARALDRG